MSWIQATGSALLSGFLPKAHLALHWQLHVARSLVVSTVGDEKLSSVTWEEIVSSSDQIL